MNAASVAAKNHFHLCLITPRYPTRVDWASMPFVRQFAWSIADLGVQVSVICPASYTSGKGALGLPSVMTETTDRGRSLKLHFPKFPHLSQKRIGPVRLGKLTAFLFHRAVKRAFEQLEGRPDVVYGHFINPAGLSAVKLGKEFSVPAFLAYGESYFWASEGLDMRTIRKAMIDLCGVIAVSSHNKMVFDSYDFLDKDKVKVFPNGVRGDLYYPRNRAEARHRLGLPPDAFIISFVGHFNQRKGMDTLNLAMQQLEGVHTLLAGKGSIQPEVRNNLFCGTLPSEQMPWFYSASDAFVLPTLNEGLSNAIVEAMACGLPIISSDLPFNYDILDDSNAILIDPSNVHQLTEAIERLRDDADLRQRMGQASLEKAKSLTLEARAHNIMEFIREEANKGGHDA